MEDTVYTLPSSEKNNYMLDPETANDDVRIRFKYRHLPKADTSSGIVRFRSVTPKQQFTQVGEDPTEALEEAHSAATRHRELAADHMAAALWLSVCVPIVQAPKPRVEKSVSKRVTIPLDHAHVQAADFDKARWAAGDYKGSFARDVAYIGSGGTAGDGRPMHEFEVTFFWHEVSDD